MQSSERSEWWVELITDKKTGTVTKVKRNEYNEYKELLNNGTSISEERQSDIDWNSYYCWEQDFKPQMSKLYKKEIDFGMLNKLN